MKATVTIEIEIQDDISQKDATDWIMYEIGYNGSLSPENPMANTELVPESFQVQF